MQIDAYEHGVPAWVDLGTPDKDGAVAFYSGLFGWDIPPGTEESGFYSVAMLGDRAAAGIGPAQNPGPPHWATYVNVDDADAIPKLVAAAGGSVIVEPMDVLDVGRMAVFADPQGAVFSVWQAKAMAGAGVVNEPGSLTWNELMTSDVEASKAFYAAVFGWGANTMGEGAGAYTEWKVADRSVGGMMAKPAEMPAEVPDHWGVYFAVADCDASVARVQELGGSVIMPAMDIEPGRFAIVADPQGASFNVMQLKPGLG